VAGVRIRLARQISLRVETAPSTTSRAGALGAVAAVAPLALPVDAGGSRTACGRARRQLSRRTGRGCLCGVHGGSVQWRARRVLRGSRVHRCRRIARRVGRRVVLHVRAGVRRPSRRRVIRLEVEIGGRIACEREGCGEAENRARHDRRTVAVTRRRRHVSRRPVRAVRRGLRPTEDFMNDRPSSGEEAMSDGKAHDGQTDARWGFQGRRRAQSGTCLQGGRQRWNRPRRLRTPTVLWPPPPLARPRWKARRRRSLPPSFCLRTTRATCLVTAGPTIGIA
jgi:hypothetical protein